MGQIEIVNSLLIEYFEADPKSIKPETRLIEDLGFDSLDAVDMLVTLEGKLNQRILADDLIACKTIGDVYELVLKLTVCKSNISA